MNHKTLFTGSLVNCGIALVLALTGRQDVVLAFGTIGVMLMWMAAAARRGK